MTHQRAYEILGISSDTSPEDAKKAYRALVKAYHPDKNTASNASFMFRLVQEAWQNIQDDLDRKRTEATESRSQDAAEAEFKKAIEKQRQLYKRHYINLIVGFLSVCFLLSYKHILPKTETE